MTFEEPSSNKIEFIVRGNSKTFIKNPQLVQKTMKKEDRYSHLVPMEQLWCKFSPYLSHTTQSNIITKEEKHDQIVWNGSTVIHPTDIAMNQVTPVAHKAPITFGHVKIHIYIVSHPIAIILLGMCWGLYNCLDRYSRYLRTFE